MPKTKAKIQIDPADALFQRVDDLFAPEETKVSDSIHYLRFDKTPIKLANGTIIHPNREGYQEVSTFLRATNAKQMLRNLIGIAILTNARRRELREGKQQPEEKEPEETPEG